MWHEKFSAPMTHWDVHCSVTGDVLVLDTPNTITSLEAKNILAALRVTSFWSFLAMETHLGNCMSAVKKGGLISYRHTSTLCKYKYQLFVNRAAVQDLWPISKLCKSWGFVYVKKLVVLNATKGFAANWLFSLSTNIKAQSVLAGTCWQANNKGYIFPKLLGPVFKSDLGTLKPAFHWKSVGFRLRSI